MGFFDRVRDVLTSSDAERARKAREGAERPAAATEQQAVTDDEHGTADDEQGTAHEPAGGQRRYRTVTVARGDTLPAIAERHGVDWREVARLNRLDNPDLIYPGQVFRLPDA